MEKLIVLYDSDTQYATRFMEFFKRKKDFEFEVSAFTKLDSLKEFICHRTIDLFIVDEQIDLEELSKDNIKNIYRLTHDPIVNQVPDSTKIFKFQSAQAIMNDLIFSYRHRNGAHITAHSQRANILSILSIRQSAEALLFTWSLCTLLSEQKKVLLIMLDLLPIQVISTIDNECSTLSEFIYYLKDKTQTSFILNESMIHHNLSYLSGISHGSDILSMNKEDIQRWVELIRTKMDYSMVIFFHSGYTDAMPELMKQSNRFLVTSNDAYYENAIYAAWTKQMIKCGISINQDKPVRVILEDEKELRNLPITPSELKYTSAWTSAEQMLSSL